jgi:hypothetical protein
LQPVTRNSGECGVDSDLKVPSAALMRDSEFGRSSGGCGQIVKNIFPIFVHFVFFVGTSSQVNAHEGLCPRILAK